MEVLEGRTKMAYDAIVVGGGIVGLSAAYHLQADGARTLLIDRNDPGKATAAGAGIVSPETTSYESETWFEFAMSSVDYYPTLMQRLEADGAGETGYARIGLISVAVSEDEDAAFEQSRRRIFARQQRYGRPSPEDLLDIDALEAQRLFPALAEIRGALNSRVAARVDGRLISGALLRAAERHGLTVRQGSVERLALQSDTATGVVVAGEMLPAGAVIIAAGAWSSELAEQLHVTLPITPHRGQIIHLRLPGVETAGWPIITAFHGHYMVPWDDSRVVVGATREADSGFAPNMTAAGVHEVLGEALRVAPGLAAATIADIRVGLRPATPDGVPVLGPVPGVRNVYIAAGHGATGLQLGPYSGKLMSDLVLGHALESDISAFSVTRFGQA